jgi:exodeoxyribonuclease-5
MIKYDELSSLQKTAHDKTFEIEEGEFFLKGYAGTGKTTMLAVLADNLGDKCVVLTPTNKAAQVLRDKGIMKARTIHSTLYQPMEVIVPKRDRHDNIIYIKNSDGSVLKDKESGDPIPEVKERKMEFQLKSYEENDLPPIALVDEGSMVTADIFDDLKLSFKKIIFFGDGFQLPPVKSKDVFSKMPADIFLDEVHRVALENPIIRYATSIRNGEEIDLSEIACDEIKTCSPNNTKLYQCLVDKNVQAITWTNRSRRAINNQIRKCKGYRDNWLEDGESIIATQNIRVRSFDGDNLKFYNGELVKVSGEYETTYDNFKALSVKTQCDRYQMMWPFWNEGFFDLKDNYNSWNAEMQRRKQSVNKPKFGSDFDFAYCLTAHKSQGSEFDNVAVWDQRHMMRNSSKEEQQRWYYTAITRAKERLLIVR